MASLEIKSSCASPANERSNTYVNEEGLEAVAEARISTGQTIPLIAADTERLEAVIERGKALAAARKIKMRLIEFSTRTDLGEFSP